MAEETKTEVIKDQPVSKLVKSWVPKLTLKPELQSPAIKVGVSREVVTKKESGGSVSDTVKPSEHKEVRFDELSRFPCKVARKWHLWSRYDYSQRDYSLLMAMTVQEIAQAERTGVWPQPK